MAFNLAPNIRQQYFDNNGDPLAGGKLYSYQAGTSTPQATYTDSTGGTPNANPVVLDANGRAAVWLNVELSYKFVLKDSSDNTIWTEDNVIGLLTNNAVSTAAIQDDAVTQAKIADDAVGADQLKDDASVDANRAVTTDHIRDAAVTRAKLAEGAVGKAAVTGIKTATYTVTTSDDTIRCNGSGGAFTINLPTAASASGRRYKFIQVGATSANAVTIDGSGAETINGATTYKLYSQYEMVEIESDGTNWLITNRYIPSIWTNLGAITITGTTANPSKGATAVDKLWVRRVGGSAEFRLEYEQSGTGSAGTGDYLIAIPSTYPIDTAQLTVDAGVEGAGDFTANNSVGAALFGSSGANASGAVVVYDSSKVRLFGVYSTGAASSPAVWSSGAFALNAASVFATAKFTLPISGWEG